MSFLVTVHQIRPNPIKSRNAFNILVIDESTVCISPSSKSGQWIVIRLWLSSEDIEPVFRQSLFSNKPLLLIINGDIPVFVFIYEQRLKFRIPLKSNFVLIFFLFREATDSLVPIQDFFKFKAVWWEVIKLLINLLWLFLLNLLLTHLGNRSVGEDWSVQKWNMKLVGQVLLLHLHEQVLLVDHWAVVRHYWEVLREDLGDWFLLDLFLGIFLETTGFTVDARRICLLERVGAVEMHEIPESHEFLGVNVDASLASTKLLCSNIHLDTDVLDYLKNIL